MNLTHKLGFAKYVKRLLGVNLLVKKGVNIKFIPIFFLYIFVAHVGESN